MMDGTLDGLDDAVSSVVHDSGNGTAIAIRNNLTNAATGNPDQEAGYQHLAKFVGVPVQTVRAYPDDIKTQATVQGANVNQLVNDNPQTAKLLTDPAKAAILHDDIPNTAALENTIKGLPQTSFWQRAGDDVSKTPEAAAKGLAYSFNQLMAGAGTAAGGIPVVGDRLASLLTSKPVTGAEDWWFNTQVAPWVNNAENLTLDKNAGFGQKAAYTAGSLLGMMAQVVLTGGEAAPLAATESSASSILAHAVEQGTKGMAVPAISSAIETGKNVYEQTGDLRSALAAATSEYGVTTGMGMVPLSAPGKLVTRLGTGLLSGLAASETGRQVMNTALPSSMRQPFNPEDLILSGLSSMILGGALGPRPVLDALHKTYTDAARAEEAEGNFQSLQQLSQFAAQSKFRERNPEQFHQFIKDVSDDGEVQHVYVDGQRLTEILNQGGIGAEELRAKLPEVATQLPDAVESKGTVQIPIADYATHIAGSKLDTQLLPHLKLDPEGITYGESQTYQQGVAKDLSDQAQQIAQKQQDNAQFQLSAQRVQDAFKAQLDQANRFPSQVNDAYSKLMRDFFTTTADRLGILPHEAMERYPLQVRADMLPGGEGTLEQAKKSGGERSRDRVKKENPFLAFLAEHGIALEHRSDITGEKGRRANPMVPGYGPIFKRNGLPLDELVARAVEEGYLTHADVESNTDNGGVNKLTEMIERTLKGEKIVNLESSEDEFEALARRNREFEEDAHERGLAELDVTPEDIEQSGFHEADPGARVAVDRILGKAPDSFSEDRLEKLLAELAEEHYLSEHQDALERLEDEFRNSPESDDNGARDGAGERGTSEPAVTVRPEEVAGNAETQRGATGAGDPDRVEPGKGTQPERGEENSQLPITGDSGRYTDARGQIRFAKDITGTPSEIALLKGADLSTFLHETGHFFLEVYSHMASLADAPAGVKEDMTAALKWMGVKDIDTWRSMTGAEKTEFHEKFARGFEAYLMEGKAPNLQMQSVYQRFRSWLLNVYRTISNLNVQLSPEIRSVFDRMLASDDAIRNAQAARGMDPLFTAKPEGMTDAEYAHYQGLGEQATTEAVNELQSRSLRDMKWLSNAKAGAMKDLQKQADAKRAEIREEVTKEVNNEPVNRARRWLRTGEMTSPEGEEIKATKGFRFNTDALKVMYPETMLNRPDMDRLKGLTSKDGLHPDLVAEMFGFRSGDELVRSLTEGEQPKEKIDAITDQRMLERHGELIDPDAIERAAEAAIHNDVRARFLATEVKALTKATGSPRDIDKGAKLAAETAINGRKVRDLNPYQYTAGERSAGKAAMAALAKGDTAEAAAQKRAQLLNNRLAKAATDAQADVQKGLDYLKKFTKESIRKKLDGDIREQIDDLLSRFDLRKNPTDKPTRAQMNLSQWVDSQRAAGYVPSFTEDMLDPRVAMEYRDMAVEQFRGLVDTVKSLEHIGRERKIIKRQGKQLELDSVVNDELVPKMLARGEKFTKEELLEQPADRLTNPVAIALDHVSSWFRATKAQLKPQEFKRNQYDMHEILGPFGEHIFDPIFDANYRKVDMLKGLSNDFQAKADELGREWQDSLHETVKNNHLVDPDLGGMLKMTRGRMIGLAIHVGNESNFDKLVRGWGWEQNPEAVWKFLHENMTAKDWDAVQTVWDLYEKHWPEVSAMNKRLGNTNPDKIEARPFKTNFGEMRGGYAAIKYDPRRSKLGEKNSAGEAINPGQGLFDRGYFRADTTTNGSLNARKDGYTDRVDLSFETIPRTMHDTIHDLAYREALINANKIIEHPDFRNAFKATYGPEAYQSMREWVGKLANSENTDRAVGSLGKFLQYTRTGIVINGIAFRLSTALKHGGSAGIKTMGYFAGGGEKYLASRFAAIGTNYHQEITGAQEKFGEIRARLLQQDRDFRAMSASMFEPESLMGKAERFGHAAVAWSDMMTAVPTAWAAYDRAIQEGIPVNQGGTGEPMTEEQAVAYANKMVREAHGSNIETARSMALNNSSEAIKMFTTLYGFMNNTYGQAADAIDKLGTAGISKPDVLARTFMAILVPAIWAGYLNEGSPKDKNAEGWAKWAGKAIAGEVAGMVPFVRDAYAMADGFYGAGMVSAEGWMNTVMKPFIDAYHAEQGKSGGKTPIKDVANAVGTGLHIPGLGQLGGSVQYVTDVARGREHPADAWEYAKGVALGRGEPKQ